MRPDFWRDKRVFLTGHTGFKGCWLSLWLQSLGAELTGYAREPATSPNLFEAAAVGRDMNSVIGDIRDATRLGKAMAEAEPDIVIHMAAQALVRESYEDPLETYSVNVIGTAQVLQAVRNCPTVRAVVSVTTDKCYQNREWLWGYRETDPLGGYDPYSSSKACAEHVTAAYRSSFFGASTPGRHPASVATVRAGNVIGGGDWSRDRLLPDILAAIQAGRPPVIRHPNAIRPWQHVLEPLCGYLTLAERLAGDRTGSFAEAWNFGPADDDARPVHWIVDQMLSRWGGADRWARDEQPQPHEATALKLDSSKARARLGWHPRWGLAEALTAIVDWQREYVNGKDMRQTSLAQIRQFEASRQ